MVATSTGGRLNTRLAAGGRREARIDVHGPWKSSGSGGLYKGGRTKSHHPITESRQSAPPGLARRVLPFRSGGGYGHKTCAVPGHPGRIRSRVRMTGTAVSHETRDLARAFRVLGPHSRRRDRAARSDVEPGDIRRILADTFILEVVGRENYLVRLAGTTDVLALRPRDQGHRPSSTSGRRRTATTIVTIASGICEDAAGAVLDVDLVSARGQVGRVRVPAPPAPSRRRPRATASSGAAPPHRRPYWFGTDPIVRQKISASKLMLARRASARARPRPEPLRRAAAGIFPVGRRPASRPPLRRRRRQELIR